MSKNNLNFGIIKVKYVSFTSVYQVYACYVFFYLNTRLIVITSVYKIINKLKIKNITFNTHIYIVQLVVVRWSGRKSETTGNTTASLISSQVVIAKFSAKNKFSQKYK